MTTTRHDLTTRMKPLIPSPVFRFVALGIGLLVLGLGYWSEWYRFGDIALGVLFLPLALFEFWRYGLSRPPVAGSIPDPRPDR